VSALEGTMELELHQLDLRYQGLRRRSARKERSVLASLSEIGQQAPVVVLAVEGDRPVLLDGYKRVRALERLRKDVVQAVAWALPEPEALILERLMRNAEGDSVLEQGWLLRELCERFGLTPTEIAKRFDKSPSWVSRRLALVRELPEPIQERVRRGQLVAHAAMKHLVPLARANRREAEQLAEACGARQLSSREVGALCAAWRGGSPATRELILRNPEVVLRAQEEARRPKEPTGPDERLLSDFAALSGIARRAGRLLRQGSIREHSRDELSRAARSAYAETDSLFTLCRKELLVAGPEHQERDPRAA
jgi:ParB family transcriptional regulator, chromosome partitioning protein